MADLVLDLEIAVDDADRIARLKKAINRVLDLEIAQQDIRADIDRDVERLRETRWALTVARRDLEYETWIAQIPTEGPSQPEAERGGLISARRLPT